MPYKNKEDQKRASAKHYAENKEKCKDRAKESSKKSIARNKKHVNSFLLDNPCVDCGEPDPELLEFDHVRGEKDKAVSYGVFSGWSIKRLQEEMDKCEVRCANCHRKVTVERRREAKDS
jgi:hypothetical protein